MDLIARLFKGTTMGVRNSTAGAMIAGGAAVSCLLWKSCAGLGRAVLEPTPRHTTRRPIVDVDTMPDVRPKKAMPPKFTYRKVLEYISQQCAQPAWLGIPCAHEAD